MPLAPSVIQSLTLLVLLHAAPLRREIRLDELGVPVHDLERLRDRFPLDGSCLVETLEIARHAVFALFVYLHVPL